MDMANKAPKWGGVWSWFDGDSRLETFGAELSRFGEDLKGYGDAVTGLNTGAAISSALAGGMLADMAANVPNWDGIWDIFTGDNKLSDFGPQLIQFGTDLKDYGIAISGLRVGAVTASAMAGMILAGMADTLPNWGGLFSDFTGDNTLGEFGSQLIDFGYDMKSYGKAISGLRIGSVMASAMAAKMLSDMANAIPTWDGLFSVFTGDNTLSMFGDELLLFAQSLVDYSKKLAR